MIGLITELQNVQKKNWNLILNSRIQLAKIYEKLANSKNPVRNIFYRLKAFKEYIDACELMCLITNNYYDRNEAILHHRLLLKVAAIAKSSAEHEIAREYSTKAKEFTALNGINKKIISGSSD